MNRYISINYLQVFFVSLTIFIGKIGKSLTTNKYLIYMDIVATFETAED